MSGKRAKGKRVQETFERDLLLCGCGCRNVYPRFDAQGMMLRTKKNGGPWRSGDKVRVTITLLERGK